MRLTGLLAMLLFIVIVFFAAPAASFAQTHGDSWAKASPDADLTTAMDNIRQHWNPTEIERDGVCYTMRTYVVARDDEESDTTHMVRTTRCLPEWKLEFKTAMEPGHRSSNAHPASRESAVRP